MAYSFGPRSLLALRGVHPDLVKVVKRALELSTVDFSVVEGVRTVARQKQLVASGASRTMNSKHIVQATGYGHAIDLAPYVGGRIRWDWPLFYPIALAMRRAMNEHSVAMVWGACWDVAWNSTQLDPLKESQMYQSRWYAAHPSPPCDPDQGPLVDGPHWQLM